MFGKVKAYLKKALRSQVNPENREILLLCFYIYLQKKHPYIMQHIWGKEQVPPLMKFPLKTYKAVYKYYLLESQRVIDFEVLRRNSKRVVLKTDLYNESNIQPIAENIIANLKRIRAIHSIEIQEDIRQKAKTILTKMKIRNCFLKSGDLRDLPYDNNTFDIILDLSTIDHIKPDNLSAVFSEYERVLKRAGSMLLVAWVDISNLDSKDKEQTQDQAPDYQYFFNKEDFLKTVRKHFAIEREDTIFCHPHNNNHQLVRLVCSKNTIWQYLSTEKMDSRIKPISEYLKNRVKDQVIVDLDCGHAPLLKYLPDTYLQYIGNDIRDIFPANINDKCVFYLKRDDELINLLTKVDILVVLGCGGYAISQEPREGRTITQTIKTIISKFGPEIIILESINRFLPILKNIEKYASRYAYKTKHHLDIKLGKDQDLVKQRIVLILEK